MTAFAVGLSFALLLLTALPGLPLAVLFWAAARGTWPPSGVFWLLLGLSMVAEAVLFRRRVVLSSKLGRLLMDGAGLLAAGVVGGWAVGLGVSTLSDVPAIERDWREAARAVRAAVLPRSVRVVAGLALWVIPWPH